MVGTVTPGDGGLSAYINAAHDMLIGSASWRAYMIAAHADLTDESTDDDFLKYVFQQDSVDDGLDWDDTEIQAEPTEDVEILSVMPFVVAYEEDDFTWTPIATCGGVQFEISGTVSFVFMDRIVREAEDAPSRYDSKLRFANWIDGVLDDWNGAIPLAPIQSITLPGAIVSNGPLSRPIESYWMAKMSITFGNGQGGG
jgi:hypothetical protein